VLNIFRRHRADCSRAGTRSQDCPSKPKCPIHYEGINGTGKRLKPQALKDPASGSGVRDWNRAVEIVRELELPAPQAPVEKPQTNLDDAIASLLAFKAPKGPGVWSIVL
jgi:hypothetical protein